MPKSSRSFSVEHMSTQSPFEPTHPRSLATILMSLWVGFLSIPMLSGQFLATDLNDQYDTGYAFRHNPLL